MKKELIIFYKNPELGKVKTRLAATMGDEAALAIYYLLTTHTRQVTEDLSITKSVWYSDFVDREDPWDNQKYNKQLQKGSHLGERMQYAFKTAFENGAEQVCIIGTDCFEIHASHIKSAYHSLEKVDAVIGPSKDGGYYLLGMKRLLPELFENKVWSTNMVFEETLKDFERLRLPFIKLPLLSDVDVEADLSESLLNKFKK